MHGLRLREETASTEKRLLGKGAVLLGVRSVALAQLAKDRLVSRQGRLLMVVMLVVVVGAAWERARVGRVGHLDPCHQTLGAGLGRRERRECDRRASQTGVGTWGERSGGKVHGNVGPAPGRIRTNRHRNGNPAELVKDWHGGLGEEWGVEEGGGGVVADERALGGERGFGREGRLVSAGECRVGGGGVGMSMRWLGGGGGGALTTEERVLEAVVRLYPAREGGRKDR